MITTIIREENDNMDINYPIDNPEKTNKPMYYMLLNAIDDIGPFFQNFYSLKESESEALSDIMNFALLCGYKDVVIDEIDIIYSIEGIDDLITDDDFDGYIQNVKNGYQSED